MSRDLKDRFRRAAASPSSPVDLAELARRAAHLRRARRTSVGVTTAFCVAAAAVAFVTLASPGETPPADPSPPSTPSPLVQTLARSIRTGGDSMLLPPPVWMAAPNTFDKALRVAAGIAGDETDGWVATFALEERAGRTRPVWIVTVPGCVPRLGPPDDRPLTPGECAADELNVVVNADTGNRMHSFAFGRSVPDYGPRPCDAPDTPEVHPYIVSPAPAATVSPLRLHVRVADGCDATFVVLVDGRPWAFRSDPTVPTSPSHPSRGRPAGLNSACMSASEFWGTLELVPGEHTIRIENRCGAGTDVPHTVPDEVTIMTGSRRCPRLTAPGPDGDQRAQEIATRWARSTRPPEVESFSVDTGGPGGPSPIGPCRKRPARWDRTFVATVRWTYRQGSFASTSASLASSTILLGRTNAGWVVYDQFH